MGLYSTLDYDVSQLMSFNQKEITPFSDRHMH
jgi:hypothetical protein